ncbi:MAG: hypothetical protein E7302_09250 [Butyrivibrio sp.]|nr:hypothetical protein [Butyrivibrio sp.]
MKNLNKRVKLLGFYIIYTLLFFAIFWGSFKYFPENGRLLLNHADAWRQHMKAVAYYSKWLRGVFYNIFVLHNFSLQTFSLGMGYGSDMYTTLQYYAIGDVLNLFSAFVKTEYIYEYFQVITVLRAYLAGITFSMFAMYVRKDAHPIALLSGMFTYSFGSYFMFLGIWHPFFANPMIYLPLVLLGAEKLLRENKKNTFIIAIFLACTNNFYFFFAITLLTVIYVLVRFFVEHGADFERLIKTCVTFIANGLLGIMMSMVILLPILLALPNNPRSKSGISVPILYQKSYYQELVRNLISFVNHGEADLQLGFSGVFLVALSVTIAVFFASGFKKKRTELVLLLLMTIFIMVPFFGYVFAGLSYVINRWCFACALFAGFVVFEVLDEILEIDVKTFVISGILLAIYAVVAKVSGAIEYEALKIQLVIALCTFALFVLVNVVDKKAVKLNKVIPFGVVQAIAFAAVSVAILFNAYEAYAPEKGNMISDYIEKTTTEDMYLQLQSTETQVVEEAAANEGLDVSGDFYRYSGRNLVWNASLLDGITSTQFCWSLTDKNVSEYFSAIANTDEQNFAYFGLDDRAILNSIAGVNYFSLRFNTPEERAFVPSGYAEVYDKFNFAIFKNGNALPFGYTSSSILTKSDFEELSHINRQEALLYGTVLEDADAEKLTSDYEIGSEEPILTASQIPFEITSQEDVQVSDGLIEAKEGGRITISFDGMAGGETYLFFKNLHIETLKDVVPVTVLSSLADGTEIQKTLSYKTENSQYYSGWHDFLINMGASADPKSYMTIVFGANGKYSFDELSVYFQPLDNLNRQLEVYKTNTMSDVQLNKNPISFATNRISGTIELEQDKLLCLEIPYSKGFTAYVDGEKADIVKSNYMFMAIPLKEGSHEIVLKYRTPGLFVGFILTLLGFGIFIYLNIRKKNG